MRLRHSDGRVLSSDGDADDPGARRPASKRVMVVTHTTGFRHPSIATADVVLGRLAGESRLFTVTFCRDAADVARLLTPTGLATVDANRLFQQHLLGALRWALQL